MTLEGIFSTWSDEDRRNLATILDCQMSSPLGLQEAIWSAYNNKARVAARTGTKRLLVSLHGAVTKKVVEHGTMRDDWREPDYEALVTEASKAVKAYEKQSTVTDLEVFIAQKLFAQAIFNMGPKERKQFFESTIDLEKLAEEAGVSNPSLRGQVATLGAMSAAQASGFGVYLFATTALGTLTSALGVTLPFLVYTGLTKLIAIVIGPVGWSALGFSVFWKLSGPNWKRILPASMYILSLKTRPVRVRV